MNTNEYMTTTLQEIAKDPIKAEEFLIKAGIILKAGVLAPEYR